MVQGEGGQACSPGFDRSPVFGDACFANGLERFCGR